MFMILMYGWMDGWMDWTDAFYTLYGYDDFDGKGGLFVYLDSTALRQASERVSAGVIAHWVDLFLLECTIICVLQLLLACIDPSIVIVMK
jgi:hypothetical protein